MMESIGTTVRKRANRVRQATSAWQDSALPAVLELPAAIQAAALRVPAVPGTKYNLAMAKPPVYNVLRASSAPLPVRPPPSVLRAPTPWQEIWNAPPVLPTNSVLMYEQVL